MAFQDIKDVVEQQEIGNAISLAIRDKLNDAQRLQDDILAKPFLISGEVDITNGTGEPINTIGGFIARGALKGFDYTGKIWYVLDTYDQSSDTTSIYARSNWQAADTKVKTEYKCEDGTYLVNQTPPDGFLLGDPHGASISRYTTYNAASIPTTAPSDTSTNMLTSLGAGDRYNTIFIHSTVTVASVVGYRTHRNSTLQFIPVPIMTNYIHTESLSKGDYLTEVYAYSTAGSNTGSITVQTSGYKWEVSPILALNLKVQLQGAYDTTTHQMRNSLATAGYIPTSSSVPYTGAEVWSGYAPNLLYPNLVSASLTTINTDTFSGKRVVDWIVVMLRSGADITNTVQSKAALLLTDGTIVAVDGGAVKFTQPEGSYFIDVRHRNHLPALSTLQNLVFGVNIYDFTTSSTQYYDSLGDGNQSVLVDGKWCVWAVDCNRDLFVDGSDGGLVNSAVTSGLTGYQAADVNLDGVCNSSDTTLKSANLVVSPYNTLINYF